MLYQVTNEKHAVEILPTNAVSEVVQNVRTILTTFQNSCPLYRDFGVNTEHLDLPVTVAKTRIAAELARQISRYEPRCTLKTVVIDAATDGTFKIYAQIDIKVE